MNEELQTQLAALLQSLLTTAADAKAFAAEQIPPLIQEKILLGRIETLAAVVLCLGFLYVGGRLLRWCHRQDWDVDRHGAVPAAAIGGGVVALFGGMFLVENVHRALLVWFAPRLYIVEWLRGMATT